MWVFGPELVGPSSRFTPTISKSHSQKAKESDPDSEFTFVAQFLHSVVGSNAAVIPSRAHFLHSRTPLPTVRPLRTWRAVGDIFSRQVSCRSGRAREQSAGWTKIAFGAAALQLDTQHLVKYDTQLGRIIHTKVKA